jgi:hypothetical protein
MAYDHSELEGLRYLLSQCAALHVQMPTVIERCDDREMTRTTRHIQYDKAVRALVQALATVGRLQSEAVDNSATNTPDITAKVNELIDPKNN